ncbi:MAG: hypothetical protein E7554_08220 [Ruminococcaceae bacterium]|nr:hypothetical protein [Oscillospiraceae bacterium]
MKKIITKAIALLTFLAVPVFISGCGAADAADTTDDTLSAAADAETVYGAISDYYGQWDINDIYQIPYVSDCSPEDAMKNEGGCVLLDAELFEAAATVIKPEYIFSSFSCEELESIGIYNCSQNPALCDGTYVISICDVNANYEQYYLVVLDSDSMLYVNPNGYVFSIEKI